MEEHFGPKEQHMKKCINVSRGEKKLYFCSFHLLISLETRNGIEGFIILISYFCAFESAQSTFIQEKVQFPN